MPEMNLPAAAPMGPPAGPALPVPPFEQLVAETSGDLYRLAVRLTGDPAEADDVLQNAYVRAFEALRAGTFRGESTLRTWLYRIVMHAAFDARRSQKRREGLAVAIGPPQSAPASSEASVELRELKEALLALPEDQRAALALKELHHLKSREVAEVMERSEGAVEQLLVRARAALKVRFEP
jgi:RNA polymerase sigma-70 factor (ECF subfamily)